MLQQQCAVQTNLQKQTVFGYFTFPRRAALLIIMIDKVTTRLLLITTVLAMTSNTARHSGTVSTVQDKSYANNRPLLCGPLTRRPNYMPALHSFRPSVCLFFSSKHVTQEPNVINISSLVSCFTAQVYFAMPFREIKRLRLRCLIKLNMKCVITHESLNMQSSTRCSTNLHVLRTFAVKRSRDQDQYETYICAVRT